MTHIKKILVPLIVLALIGVLLFSLNNKAQAPDVTFTTLDGQQMSMQSLKGKVVLVNFWATDCPGCIKEMPAIVKAYEDYKDKGFEVVAVAMPYDPPAQVANFTKMKALPFLVMHDGLSNITAAFGGVNLTPTTFIFDQQGNRIKKVIGEITYEQLSQLLTQELS